MAVAENPNRQGHAVRRHRPRRSTTRSTTARTGRSSRTDCRAAPVIVDRRAEALARRRRLDVRPRPLHPARHHDARAVATRRRPTRRRCTLRRRGRLPPARAAAARTSRSRSRRRRRDPVKLEILDATGAVDPHDAGAGARRTQPRRRGICATTRRAQVALAHDAARQPAHLGGAALQGQRETRPIVHWGIQGAQVTGPIAAPGRYTVAPHASAARRTRKPFEVVQGSGDRRDRRRSRGVDRRCRSASATT